MGVWLLLFQHLSWVDAAFKEPLYKTHFASWGRVCAAFHCVRVVAYTPTLIAIKFDAKDISSRVKVWLLEPCSSLYDCTWRVHSSSSDG